MIVSLVQRIYLLWFFLFSYDLYSFNRPSHVKMTCTHDVLLLGAGVKMEHFQAALDPRKQELLEARFLGAKVSNILYPM